MTTYFTLSTDDLRGLRRERVRALELDHARLSLVFAEEVDEAARRDIAGQMAEVDRRIGVHVDTDPTPTPVPADHLPLDVSEPRHAEAPNETVTTSAPRAE